MAQYAAKGFLEDLMPYLNGDSTVSPDNLMGSVLNAVKTDGKLYQLPTSFQVVSAAGKREIVGGYESWTTDEVEDALKKAPGGRDGVQRRLYEIPRPLPLRVERHEPLCDWAGRHMQL